MGDLPGVFTHVRREQPIMQCYSQLGQVSANRLCETFFIANFIEELIVRHHNQVPGWQP